MGLNLNALVGSHIAIFLDNLLFIFRKEKCKIYLKFYCMETLIAIIDFFILGIIIATPILLLTILKKSNLRSYSIIYFMIGIILSGLIIWLFAWWTDISNSILLKHYGCNVLGINTTELYKNVMPSDLERVWNIENSMMGIGWPLKAIFGFIIFIPYLCVVFIVSKIIEKRKST